LTYLLGPDDEIVVHSPDIPDVNGKPMRLDPDGDLRLPIVGRVRAAGMTLEQLEAELVNRLKVFVHTPDVAVSVTEFHSHAVSIIGAVGTSGVHRLEGNKTLIEMLSLAAGVTAEAGPVVRLTRRIDWGRIPLAAAADDPTGGFSIVDIELTALLEGRTPEMNVMVRPNDIISVPRAEMVFVIGEVARPGSVALRAGKSVSVMEAVSSSGGVLRTGSGKHARILRPVAGAQARTEIEVDINRIMQGKAKDMPLMAGDILVVPDGKGRRAAARALEMALQVGMMAGTYGLASR
jgi:polysaccharide export outer membrane protein